MPLIVKIHQNKRKAAAGEVISALHDAKQEVAKELEANLKQLKSVLEDTQRIAKEMEAVLRESIHEPTDQQKAQGNSESSSAQSANKQQSGGKENTNQQEAQNRDAKQQSNYKPGEKQAGSKSTPQGRDVKVKVVTGRTYVAARPKAWVLPPYRTMSEPKADATSWDPPSG